MPLHTPFPETVDPLRWESVQPLVDELLAVELSHATVEAWLRRWSDLTCLLKESAAQVYRAVTENTADEEAERRFTRLVEEISPKERVAQQALREKLLAFRDFQPTPEQAPMMAALRADAALFREANVPLLSELMKLENQYDRLIGGATIEWEGSTETLPQAMAHLQEADRATRERAWRLIMARFGEERARLNELYLEMIRLRHQVAQNAGLPDFRAYQWQALGRFDYTPDDCFAFHEAIEREVVPLATEQYAALREALGVARLRPWDEKADPHGEPLRPFQDVAALEEGCHRIFQRVDPVLAAQFATLREGQLDLGSRPNKAPGGYCESFPVSGRPYIFMNAVGTQSDVQTLLHEGGHAFHALESEKLPLFWQYHAPMEFCEVASMAMELLGAPYLAADEGGFYANDVDARRAYRELLLSNAIFFLPYMAVVDAFQHWVYTEGVRLPTLSAAALDAQWGQLWDRFMPGVDYEGLENEKVTGWHRKTHIFTVPFYYVEYGLAQVGALQVWRNALADQAQAVAAYRAALALGNTRPLPALFEAAGARFAFDRETVGGLMALVREQVSHLS